MNCGNEVKDSFITNLERFMKATGMSGGQIARELNVDPSAVSSWRNGRYFPNLEKLSQLADIFGCKVTDLLEKPTKKINGVKLTDAEYQLLSDYRKADEQTREMVKRLLKYNVLIANPDHSVYKGGDKNEKP